MEGSVDDFAERLAEAIKGMGGGENPIILGNGCGGFLALHLTILYPDLPSRHVLADSVGCFSEEELRAIEETAMRRLFAAAAAERGRRIGARAALSGGGWPRALA